MPNKYEGEMMDLASKLDAITNSCGEITKIAGAIVESQNDESIQLLIKRISDISGKKASPTREVRQLAKSLKDSLVSYCGYKYIKKIVNQEEEFGEDTRTLDELILELNKLISGSHGQQSQQQEEA